MHRTLSFGRRAALRGTSRSLVVFVHGYGADGNDLLGLADALSPHLPDTAFVAPDAPESIEGFPQGRRWFGIPRFDGSSVEEVHEGLTRSAADLNAFLDARLSEEALGPEALAVVGFSQGAMVSYEAVPRRAAPVAAVVAISGALLYPQVLHDATSRPPFLVMHGEDDEVVPFGAMEEARDALVACGFSTEGHVMTGTGHGISEDGVARVLAFLKKLLPG
jgi:phospholipase/carboxylesterase